MSVQPAANPPPPPDPNTGRAQSLCVECGAVVADLARHEAYHIRVSDAFASLNTTL